MQRGKNVMQKSARIAEISTKITGELLFTARHVMQTRYSDENSVCLSVRLSVTLVYCDKTEKRSVQIFIPYER